MKIVEVYSHLNGKEHILVHKKKLWREIERAPELRELDAALGERQGP